MKRIKIIEQDVVIYDNPMPHLYSRHGYFPGMVQLPSGDLLALFTVGEAFEAVNLTTCVSRSSDLGKTWRFEGPLYDKAAVGFPTSDTLKPTLLKNGTLVATGYRFHRRNPDEAIGNPLTNGALPADNIISSSRDEGRTWSVPVTIRTTWPELVENSGPCIELRSSGNLISLGGLFRRWDGSQPSGQRGIQLRSKDGGRTWDDAIVFFDTPDHSVTPFETRLCEMQDDRVVALVWAFDQNQGTSLTNHVTVSHDGGERWSAPIDTGIPAQASNLMWLGEDLLLTIHAHREGIVGLYVRIVDFAGDRWRVVEEVNIWDRAKPQADKGMAHIGKALRFGQPSLLRLTNGEIAAVHWCIEDGQGRIKLHRLRVHSPF